MELLEKLVRKWIRKHKKQLPTCPICGKEVPFADCEAIETRWKTIIFIHKKCIK